MPSAAGTAAQTFGEQDGDGPTLLDQMLRDSGVVASGSQARAKQQPDKGFGSGLRRGFLNSAKQKHHQQQQHQQPQQQQGTGGSTANEPNMPTIKLASPPSSFVLPEVQAAMDAEAKAAAEQRTRGLPPVLQALERGGEVMDK